MSDNQIPATAEAPVSGAIDTAIHGIFEQVFNEPTESVAPVAPVGTVVTSDQPRIADAEVEQKAPVELPNPNGNPVESAPKPEERSGEETGRRGR